MLSLGKTEKKKTWLNRKGWDARELEQEDLPSENLLNLNFPHHSKCLPER